MYDILHDIDIAATPTDIFQMITHPQNLNQWWTVKSTGEPSLNETYNFYFSDDYNWFAKVIHIEENRSVIFEMTQADSDWAETVLSFDIIRKSETLQTLRFEHKNWQTANNHFRRTSFCWALYFDKMKRLLEEKK